jgi:hypothetical protein
MAQCSFCLGARRLERGTDYVFQDDLLTCPRCLLPSYCSRACGMQAAQAHDVLCFDAASEVGAEIAAAYAAVVAVSEKADATEYARVVASEAALFGDLYASDADSYEARAFPHIFCLGGGTYGQRRGSAGRFCEYRRWALYQRSGRCLQDHVWMSWAACVQARLELALCNERLGRPRGWDGLKEGRPGRFDEFLLTLVPRTAFARGLSQGARVTLRDLVSAPHLNGTVGSLGRFDSKLQRWAVHRSDGTMTETLAVRSKNVFAEEA